MSKQEQQLALGLGLRDQGTEAVLAADVSVLRGWREHADKVIAELVETGKPFTASDIRRLLPTRVQPHHPNLIGAVIRAWSRSGRIRRVGFAQATMPSCRGRTLAVWQATAVAANPAA